MDFLMTCPNDSAWFYMAQRTQLLDQKIQNLLKHISKKLKICKQISLLGPFKGPRTMP